MRDSETLYNQALAKIRRGLFGGQFPPGSVISATALSNEPGWPSRSPINTALLILAERGLVRPIGLSGFMVREVEIEHVAEVIQLVFSTALEAAVWLLPSDTPEGYEPFEEHLASLSRLADKLRPDQDEQVWTYFEQDTAFFSLLAREAELTQAERVLGQLFDHWRLFSKGGPAPRPYADECRRSVEEKRAIVSALSRRDREKLRLAFDDHKLETARRWGHMVHAYVQKRR